MATWGNQAVWVAVPMAYSSPEGLLRVVTALAPGQEARLNVERNRQPLTLTVRVGTRPLPRGSR